MLRAWSFFLFLIFFFLRDSYAIDTKSRDSFKKLIFIGDSLTEGYGVSKEKSFPALLENKISKKNWIVINSGVGGSTSASAPSRMKWVLKSKPDLIILALGANDSLRGLPVKETKKNLHEALSLATQNHSKIVLVGMKAPPNYGKTYGREFENIFKSLSLEFKIKLIPFLLDGVAGNSLLNQSDQIHPNEKGHRIISETIYKAIESDL